MKSNILLVCILLVGVVKADRYIKNMANYIEPVFKNAEKWFMYPKGAFVEDFISRNMFTGGICRKYDRMRIKYDDRAVSTKYVSKDIKQECDNNIIIPNDQRYSPGCNNATNFSDVLREYNTFMYLMEIAHERLSRNELDLIKKCESNLDTNYRIGTIPDLLDGNIYMFPLLKITVFIFWVHPNNLNLYGIVDPHIKHIILNDKCDQEIEFVKSHPDDPMYIKVVNTGCISKIQLDNITYNQNNIDAMLLHKYRKYVERKIIIKKMILDTYTMSLAIHILMLTFEFIIPLLGILTPTILFFMRRHNNKKRVAITIPRYASVKS